MREKISPRKNTTQLRAGKFARAKKRGDAVAHLMAPSRAGFFLGFPRERGERPGAARIRGLSRGIALHQRKAISRIEIPGGLARCAPTLYLHVQIRRVRECIDKPLQTDCDCNQKKQEGK
jgi:hypothetical protein